MLASCLLAVYVGLRTLWIFTRTRQPQELAIGINVLGVAVGATILTILGVMGKTNADVDQPGLYLAGLLFLALHIVAIYVGTWKIFRPGSTWLVVPCTVLLAVVGYWVYVSYYQLGTVWQRPILFQALRGGGMAWSAFECFSYSDRLRRQAALGLVDPMLAHRIWLWAVGATSALIVCTLELMGWGLGEQGIAGPAIGLMVTAGLGFIGAMSVALAFFPPSFYVHWLSPRLTGAGLAQRAAGADQG